MSLFTPAWQGENLEKALKAVAKCKNHEKLKEIAMTAPSTEVRLAALDRMSNVPNSLLEIIYANRSQERRKVYEKAFSRLDDFSLEGFLLRTETDADTRRVALQSVRYRGTFENILKKTKDRNLRLQTIQAINDPEWLKTFALDDTVNVDECIEAVRQLSDPKALQSIIIWSKSADVVKAALDQMPDTDFDSLFSVLRQTCGCPSAFAEWIKANYPDEAKRWAKQLREMILFKDDPAYQKKNYMIRLIDLEPQILDENDEIAAICSELMREFTPLLQYMAELKHPLAYPVLLEKAARNEWHACHFLSNYPSEETVKVLQECLTRGERYAALWAADSLKAIYTGGDSKLRSAIRQIPQRQYYAHDDWGVKGRNCHEDYSEVNFFLEK